MLFIKCLFAGIALFVGSFFIFGKDFADNHPVIAFLLFLSPILIYFIATIIKEFEKASAINKRNKINQENAQLKKAYEKLAITASHTNSIEEFRYYLYSMDGHQFEYFAAEWLRCQGWKKVEVTQGSGDFGADVIGYALDGKRYAVQCKKHDRPVGVKAIQEVTAARIHYYCEGAAVVSISGYTPAARKLASECNVLLMNINA